jgi:flagellar L-ring protein precursor FlgH
LRKTAFALLTSCLLTGCGALDRVENIGKPPDQSAIQNPQLKEGYQPVNMPMPAPKTAIREKDSLWDSNRQAFFKDQRASNVGDILTVMININDKGQLNDETKRQRTSAEDAGMPNLLGIEASLNRVLPQAVDPASLVKASSDSNHDGKASIARQEQIQVKLAALITQVLPNGNFVIHGSQEVLVNYENRVLTVDGVIRPQDVSVDNNIPYEQIAEARITYGGKGQLTDVQQPRYGQQLYDVLFPF